MAWSDAPIGLVPPFLRGRSGAASPGGGRDAAPAAAARPDDGPLCARTFEAAPETKTESRPARPSVSHLYALADAETLRVRRKASDALGLASTCQQAACRRAKACAGVAGAICLIDARDFVVSALRSAQAGGTEE